VTEPTIVRIDSVSKRFVINKHKSIKERVVNARRDAPHREEFQALQSLTLDIKSGSTVGLVGHNGSGKSTLLKIIGGIIDPSGGTVQRRGRMAALLELGAGFHPDLTGRENVYLNAAILGLTHKETDKQFDAIVEFSEIGKFIDSQVKFYSSGMYVRLAFAVAVHVDPDLLLVDEVLAVGDEPFQKKCMEKIAEFQREGRTIVLVSHSADTITRLCDRVVVLDHGHMLFDGDARTGIDVLREGYRAAASEPASLVENSFHIGELATTIDRGADGRSNLRAQVTVNGAVSLDLLAHFAVVAPDGHTVYTVGSDELGGLPAMVDEELPLNITFAVDVTTLRPGSYAVTIGLEQRDTPGTAQGVSARVQAGSGASGGGVVDLRATLEASPPE
jgi:ABC-2 type transport system ATP-binding protein